MIDSSSLLNSELKKLGIVTYSLKPMDVKEIRLNIGEVLNRTHVISSTESGLGKSHKIKKFAEIHGMKYYKFPICDEIDLASITKRLFELDDNEQ